MNSSCAELERGFPLVDSPSSGHLTLKPRQPRGRLIHPQQMVHHLRQKKNSQRMNRIEQEETSHSQPFKRTAPDIIDTMDIHGYHGCHDGGPVPFLMSEFSSSNKNPLLKSVSLGRALRGWEPRCAMRQSPCLLVSWPDCCPSVFVPSVFSFFSSILPPWSSLCHQLIYFHIN